MGKLLKYLFLSLVVILWIYAFFENRYHSIFGTTVIPDTFKYGDLYRVSRLPQFKEPTPNCISNIPASHQKVDANLYIIGDSFADKGRIDSNFFVSRKFKFTHWSFTEQLTLDTNQRNVLVIESVERGLFQKFGEKRINYVKTIDKPVNPAGLLSYWHYFWERFEYNASKVEERLYHILYYWDIVLFFREIKANIDYFLFEQKSDNFVLNTTKTEIYYADEANPEHQYSSFYPIADAEIDNVVFNLNYINQAYKAMGFDEVYLNVLPNKVSWQEPTLGQYNQLLDRVLTHEKLELSVIDTRPHLKKLNGPVFYRSDTHWTCPAKGIWVNQINDILNK